MHISVVIPAYNEEAYIGQCLEAIGQQVVQPDEIVVVDNNCTDRTVEIASSYPLVRIVKEPKQGMIMARNCGFSSAKGNLIARCDADSKPHPSWLKVVQEDFEKHRIDALTGPIMYYDMPAQSIHLAQMYFVMVKSMQRGRETLVGPNMVITKAIWDKVKDRVCLNDKEVHEDLDLAIHIHEAGGKIMRDKRLIVQTSSRRITRNAGSFFGEYPIRFVNTLLMHQQPIPVPKTLLSIPKVLKDARRKIRDRMLA